MVSVKVKPLIQDEKTNEKPYQADADLRMTNPAREGADDGATITSMMSSSLLGDERSVKSGGASTVRHSV